MSGIIDWILKNWFILFLIGSGLFNVALRVSQKFKEQRELRKVQAQIKAQNQEERRTGRPMTPKPQVQPKQVQQTRESKQVQAEREEAQARAKAQARERRIEQLRQERLAQLRALREQNNAISQSFNSNPTQVIIPPQPDPAQRRVQQPSPKTQAHQEVVVRSDEFDAIVKRAQSSPRSPKPSQNKKESESQTRIAGQIEKGKVSVPEGSTQTKGPKKSTAGTSDSLRSMLGSSSSVRQAILLSEILNPPLANREDQTIRSIY